MSSPMQFRVSLTVSDFSKAVSFYRDALGLELTDDWSTDKGKCVVFAVEKATIEIVDRQQAQYIDKIEVGEPVSGQVRLALQFESVELAVGRARTGGAKVLKDPVETPWKDVNARILGPDGMQVTLFQSPSVAK